MDMPNIDSLNNEIMIPNLRLGDAVLFNFKIVHGASGNNSQERRRAFSIRFTGDDVRYLDRGGATSPPSTGINLKSGDSLRTDWFPVVWRNEYMIKAIPKKNIIPAEYVCDVKNL